MIKKNYHKIESNKNKVTLTNLQTNLGFLNKPVNWFIESIKFSNLVFLKPFF
jgi:hypothetical protein